MISEPLQHFNFRFCKLKPKTKIPYEKEWEKKGYMWNSPILQEHLEQGGNYGVIGGYGSLRILDIDDKSKVEEFKEKFKTTFLVQTGSGGLHIYILSDYDINNVLKNGLGEFRAKNYQVVGAGSTHPNGNKYIPLNNNPPVKYSREKVEEILKPYLRDVISSTEIKEGEKDESRSGKEYRAVLNFLRRGKTREHIYKEMEIYHKWVCSGDDYKNLTYTNAYDFYLQEQEKKALLKPEIKEPTQEQIEVLKDINLLEEIDKELDKKIVREHEARKTIFMVCNMRNVENLGKATDNLMVNAPSGTGKDYLCEGIFELIPEQEKEELIRTTPKVLAYTRNKKIEPNSSWKKCVLRLEDASNEVLNDDSFKVFSSANPIKVNRGKTINKGKVIEIEIEGKPTMIMTIAEATPREELLRRFPICSLDEGINQTKEILKRQSEYAKTGKTIEYNEILKESLKFLKRIKVKIPFAERLVNIFNPQNIIVRTHFPRFLDYIKSSCSLFQYQRKQDEEGYYIAEQQDYEIAKMMLSKTTSNFLMIPLDKTKKHILDLFEKEDLQRKSVDDLEDYSEIKELNITSEWLRKQLDWLNAKTFLLKDKERRVDEAGKTISKPIFIYSYNKMQRLEIPDWNTLISSNTYNCNNSSNSSNSSNRGVNEVNELFEQKRNITFGDLGTNVEVIK